MDANVTPPPTMWAAIDEAEALGLNQSVVSKARRRTASTHPVNGPHASVIQVGKRSSPTAPAAEVIAWWHGEVTRVRSGRPHPPQVVQRIHALAVEYGIAPPAADLVPATTAPQEQQ